MPCSELMILNPPALRVTHRVFDAVELLALHRVYALPVVDSEGRFVGMFDIHQLLKLVLPKAATMDHGLTDLSYVHDTLGTWPELRIHLQNIGDEPLADYVDTEVPVAHPDTPSMETLRRLYRSPTLLPVVDDDGTLAGVVTFWDVLHKLAQVD